MVAIARDSGEVPLPRGLRAGCRVAVGDARLELGKVADDTYDVLAIDAFSSDAIPMHLMTREAFDLYDRVVRTTGWCSCTSPTASSTSNRSWRD